MNLRPPRPERGALPSCATSRRLVADHRRRRKSSGASRNGPPSEAYAGQALVLAGRSSDGTWQATQRGGMIPSSWSRRDSSRVSAEMIRRPKECLALSPSAGTGEQGKRVEHPSTVGGTRTRRPCGPMMKADSSSTSGARIGSTGRTTPTTRIPATATERPRVRVAGEVSAKRRSTSTEAAHRVTRSDETRT